MDLIFFPISGAALDSLITLWGLHRFGRRIESNPLIVLAVSRIGNLAAFLPLATAIPASIVADVYIGEYFLFVLGALFWYPVIWNVIALALMLRHRVKSKKSKS